MNDDNVPQIRWTDNDKQPQQARWRSLADYPPPKRIAVVDDTLDADSAYRLACEGVGLLWCGDFQNARLLMQAMIRRIDSKAQRSARPAQAVEAASRPRALLGTRVRPR